VLLVVLVATVATTLLQQLWIGEVCVTGRSDGATETACTQEAPSLWVSVLGGLALAAASLLVFMRASRRPSRKIDQQIKA
jgi:hypothetical protein